MSDIPQETTAKPGLSKTYAVTLILAGAALAIESLDSIVKHEGHERAKLAFEFSQIATRAIEGESNPPPKLTFDVALAYAGGVTLNQLEYWQGVMREESKPCPHIDAAVLFFRAKAEKENPS